MTIKEYNKLQIGDIVSPVRGLNKGKKARVTYIHDVIDKLGYREVLISAEYIDKEQVSIYDGYAGWGYSFDMSYRQLNVESE